MVLHVSPSTLAHTPGVTQTYVRLGRLSYIASTVYKIVQDSQVKALGKEGAIVWESLSYDWLSFKRVRTPDPVTAQMQVVYM